MSDATIKLEKDTVLEGPLWPEPVRISGIEAFGDLWQVDAVGMRSRQFYPGTILTADQLPLLKVTAASSLDFSGDAEAFHLAIEAQRIRLAHQVDLPVGEVRVVAGLLGGRRVPALASHDDARVLDEEASPRIPALPDL